MPSKYKTPLLIVYALFALIMMFSRFLGLPELEYFSKPFLMPVLMLWFYFSLGSQKGRFEWAILIALFFSWLGDLFLMFQSNGSPHWFLFGLGAFLLAHIGYIVSFTTTKRPLRAGAIWDKPWLGLPFLSYGIGLMYLLWPTLGGMKIPVLVYACAIVLMVLTAANRYLKVPFVSYNNILIGAVLFVISDSIIAINKFYYPFNSAGFWIMLTYCLAQYLIVAGAIKQVMHRSSAN